MKYLFKKITMIFLVMFISSLGLISCGEQEEDPVKNTYLSQLSIDGVDFSEQFDKEKANYRADVTNDISQVELEVEAESSAAEVSAEIHCVESKNLTNVNDPIDLKVGYNYIYIFVRSEDGLETRKYTVKINRAGSSESNNAFLSDIELENISFSFDKQISQYDLTVENSVTETSVASISTEDSNATAAYVSGSISLGEDSTTAINVIVTAEDGTTTKKYTFNVYRKGMVEDKVAKPSITASHSEPYDTNTTFTLSCATSGASIEYKIDSGSYQAYTGAFTVSQGNHYIFARATKSGLTDSDVADKYVTINSLQKVNTPAVTASQSSPYDTATNFSISCATSGASIQYKIDNGSYQSYTGSFNLTAGSHTIYAKATKYGLVDSDVLTMPVYINNIQVERVSTPVISASGSTPYDVDTTFTVSCATSGASIQYKIDSGSYQTYTGGFKVSAGSHTIYAKATKSGMTDSLETSKAVTINDITREITALGADYHSTYTSFAIWSPDSSNVKVVVDGTEYDCTSQFISGYSNVYGTIVSGDLHLKEYQFEINGVAVRDPYGKMVKFDSSLSTDDTKPSGKTYTENSASVTANTGSNVNIVIDTDRTEPDGGWAARPALVNREDAIIYEIHVRDFTIDSNSGVSSNKKGKFMGMVEEGTTYSSVKTGIDHLKELGVTHVQIMPFYDFATKYNASTGQNYNWGYDPVNYNVPEERYSMDPSDYEYRIKELKTMINEFHKNGIRVIMDVVYNHTFWDEMFDDISTDYYFHYNGYYSELGYAADSSGKQKANLSGCGNGIDTSNPMVSRFIRDSLEYWVKEFNIDGFRFDLMGAMTTNDVKDWGNHFNGSGSAYADRNLLMFGEPWDGYWEAGTLYWDQASQGLKNEVSSRTSQHVRLGRLNDLVNAHVGVFNGKYREDIKGNNDGNVRGYMFNSFDNTSIDYIKYGMRGAIGNQRGDWDRQVAGDPEQIINYISAHDNLCLADKISTCGVSGFYAEQVGRFGMAMVMTSQGIPFMHGGDEMLRVKAGAHGHNSYMWGDTPNKIHWSWKVSNSDAFNFYKDLVALRKNHPGMRMTSKSDIENYMNVWTEGGNKVIAQIDEDKNGSKDLVIVYNSGSNFTVSLPSGSWKRVFNLYGAVNDSSTECIGSSVTVFAKQ